MTTSRNYVRYVENLRRFLRTCLRVVRHLLWYVGLSRATSLAHSRLYLKHDEANLFPT